MVDSLRNTLRDPLVHYPFLHSKKMCLKYFFSLFFFFSYFLSYGRTRPTVKKMAFPPHRQAHCLW